MRLDDLSYFATAVADSCWLTKAYSRSIVAAKAYTVCDDRVVKNKNDITLGQQRLHGGVGDSGQASGVWLSSVRVQFTPASLSWPQQNTQGTNNQSATPKGHQWVTDCDSISNAATFHWINLLINEKSACGYK